jgi:tRNA nucleotidyltransferase (CCA-adding enzyme)
MVGKDGMPMPLERIDNLATALKSAYPELETVRDAAGGDPVYLVGGSVRDLLLGRPRTDIDIVVVGDAGALAGRLGLEPVTHERFATAKVMLDGHGLDIATARAESYAHPGSLPSVRPAGDIEADLGRRDFSINAMAIPLTAKPDLIDPHHGRTDLEAGLLRVLSSHSFEDDPTRALRAARYAARFGFVLEADTEALLRKADLGTVSADRREADLLRLAAEPNAALGLEMLADWGLVDLRPGGVELATRVAELLDGPPWQGLVARDRAMLAAALGPERGERELAQARPERPSEGVQIARHREPVELLLARAQGAEWLDDYVARWRLVKLEIDGGDLIEAGVPEGPAIGRGLADALRRKLDGEIDGRAEELEAALSAARADRGSEAGRPDAGGADGVA